MIVLREENGLIYVASNTKEIYYTQILYNFPGWSREEVEPFLRPWRIIELEDGHYYSPDVLDYFERNKSVKKSKDLKKINYEEVSEDEKNLNIERALSSIYLLRKLKTINPSEEDKSKFEQLLKHYKYKCDFLAILKRAFGKQEGTLVYSMTEERKPDIEWLLKLAGFNRKEDKIRWIEDDERTNLFKYIPDRLKIELHLFQSRPVADENEILNPLYQNEELLFSDKTLPLKIKDKIYEYFKVDEILEGDEIRKRLNLIWEELGIDEKPKLKTIFSYFDTNIQRSGYKLITRK